MNRSCPRGATTTDVLAIAVIVLLCTAALLPAAMGAKERANRIKCQSNLSMIGKGLILYSNENKGLFPRTKADMQSDKLNFFTVPNLVKADDKEAKAHDPFDQGSPEVNDITAALYLLIRQEDLSPDVFLCPSVLTDAEKKAILTDHSVTSFKLGDDPAYNFQMQTNFPSPKYLHYSFVNVYPTQKAIGNGYKTFMTAYAADFAVAADLNPGGKELTTLTPNMPMEKLRIGNSPNHGGDGQNVLYADGHAEFQQRCFCGAELQKDVYDNIYTCGKVTADSGGQAVVGDPVDQNDSVLLPTAEQQKAPATQPAK